jgi:hypothetical protein
VTLKILIGRFSRNFFSRTADGIELKSGLEQKSTQVRIMGITNFPMHTNGSAQCVGLVSTNQDNFLGPHKKQEKQRVTNLKDGPRFFWDHLLPTAHVNSSFIIL